MPKTPIDLTFSQSPTIHYAGNVFINVPIILQYDKTPLIEVFQEITAGFTSQFCIYNKDGVYIAKVTGSRLDRTPEGKTANIKLRHPDLMTVCELDGKTLFEIRREGPAALHTKAELFAPDGRFIKANNQGVPDVLISGNHNSIESWRKKQAILNTMKLRPDMIKHIRQLEL